MSPLAAFASCLRKNATCANTLMAVIVVQNVLQAVLTVMGLTPQEVNDTDTLSRLGIDSMQLVEVSFLAIHEAAGFET